MPLIVKLIGVVSGRKASERGICSKLKTETIFAVGFWAGWTDELVEGTFIDPNTGEELFVASDGFHPFHPGIVVQGLGGG